MSCAVHLQLGRMSNLPTVWSNVLAAAVLAGGAAPAQILLLAVAASALYTGGMYLNDAFDRGYDARERPERPIPSGVISADRVFAIGFALLAAGAALVAIPSFAWEGGGDGTAIAAALTLAGVITLYDAWHKANPLAPVLMGACRALVYLTAGLAVSGRTGGALLGGALVLLLYVAGLSYTAQQENLDRMKNWWPLAVLGAPFLYTLPAVARDPVVALFYFGFLIWVGYNVAALKRGGRARIRRAVVGLIAGIALLDALLIAHAGVPALAALAAGGWVLTLYAQRWAPGT